MYVSVGQVGRVLWHNSAFRAAQLDLIDGSSGIRDLAPGNWLTPKCLLVTDDQGEASFIVMSRTKETRRE
jgi:hypothetical protein